MNELVTYIVKQFAINHEKLSVTSANTDENTVTITVALDTSDMGRVIGKQGKIAKAIRTIVKSASSKESVKYLVEIVEAE